MYNHQFAGCDTPFRSRMHKFHKPHHSSFAYRRPKYNVPLNVIENETAFEVHVYATGFSKEEIKVTVVNDVLFISGSKNLPEDYKPNFSLQEFPIKSFERSLLLNDKVNVDAITAKQENNVLIIALPKNEITKTEGKTIEVL